jgi:hypothetical protein
LQCKNINSKIFLGRQIWKFYELSCDTNALMTKTKTYTANYIVLGKNPMLNNGATAKTWGKCNY